MARLRLFRSLWGCLEGDVRRRFPTLPSLLHELKGLGYDGIEASLNDLGEDRAARERAAQAVSDAGLCLIVGCYSSWVDYEQARDDHYAPPVRHLQRLQEQINMALDLGPVHINCHSGSDAWGREECVSFFQRTADATHTLLHKHTHKHGAHTGLSHETHRGRPLGHPFTAYHIGQQVPSLRLTADVSHWFLVCERLLPLPSPFPLEACPPYSLPRGSHKEEGHVQGPIKDLEWGDKETDKEGRGAREVEGRVMAWAAGATDHVHARVGTPQAPQVWGLGDASASASGQDHHDHVHEAVTAHTRFWKGVLSARLANAKAKGGGNAAASPLTLTPEYGPSPYTPLCPSPYGPTPANDHWALTNAAADHLRTALGAHLT